MKLPVTHTTVQVRFSDTDAVGHISSGSYITYMEVGRTDFLYELGKHSDMPMSVVVNINIDFVSETLFGEQLTVTTWCAKLGKKSMTLCNEIRTDDRLVSKGTVTIVGFDTQTRTSVPFPAHWEPSDYPA